MSAIILHHYPLSPYSEKVRLAMGLKGLSWRSVEIPIWTPRPKLTPMTGGYRRTPILQIGADFYCDTLLILGVLEKTESVGRLYPSGQEGVARALGWWIEKGSFMNAVCLTVGNMGGKLPQELIDERRPFFNVSIDPAELLPKRATYLQRVNAHIAWLAEMLGDGRNSFSVPMRLLLTCLPTIRCGLRTRTAVARSPNRCRSRQSSAPGTTGLRPSAMANRST